MTRPTPCNFRHSVNASEDTRTERARLLELHEARMTAGRRVALPRVMKLRVGVAAILALCALGARFSNGAMAAAVPAQNLAA